ncbi:polysaccharide pyruvyl transferase family protein [Leptolyngbya sp. FACHB-541]|uniref:polysaccharide pyruvyl transferase family protein n=1 Tax=Leptolyngbya sp. FACHB-541 TaxID=2692810 RepID=UPI001685680D|nr:polysaccharide pyruvyl transferase family protein [Leptolyngbya sp. FACHB-541]MBD2001465.1 polysaccharide pyruvyl transferase family protein [Leptolyngbya sp. FACHB-541]
MRILVEQSGYELKNMGDLAMLQVLVARLHKIFPGALIHVFTTAPEILHEYIPNAQPVSPFGREMRFSPLIHQVHGVLPKGVAKKWLALEDLIWSLFPSLSRSYVKFKLRKVPDKVKDVETFLDVISKADLVVASGGGYINDEFGNHANFALETLKLATKLGKPTAMLGQGFGPLQNRELYATAKATLPAIDLLTLREKRVGMPLLKSLGVPQEGIVVTGDDAIELAYSSRKPELGDSIGINLRVAAYSGVNAALLEVVKSALQTFARQKEVSLLPIPIAHGFYKGFMETDSASIQQLLAGYDDTSDGGESLDTPLKVIEQVGKCRVVITGSYHAGVFSLSQGVPVVCLAKSQYYVDKFRGLADQFGVGCEVLLLDDKDIGEKLLNSIQSAWHTAAQIKPQLLEAAQKQIESGHAAYKRVYEIAKF